MFFFVGCLKRYIETIHLVQLKNRNINEDREIAMKEKSSFGFRCVSTRITKMLRVNQFKPQKHAGSSKVWPISRKTLFTISTQRPDRAETSFREITFLRYRENFDHVVSRTSRSFCRSKNFGYPAWLALRVTKEEKARKNLGKSCEKLSAFFCSTIHKEAFA